MTTLAHLRPLEDLAEAKPHGARLKYMAGCRCLMCRAANSRYETRRLKLRKKHGPNIIVPADRARRKIEELSTAGVGYKTVADAVGMSKTTVFKVRSGTRKNLRRYNELAILSLRAKDLLPDSALVDARPTWTRIEWLLSEGFSKAELARRLGYRSPALQFRKDFVTAKTELKIRKFYEAIRLGEDA